MKTRGFNIEVMVVMVVVFCDGDAVDGVGGTVLGLVMA